MFRKSSDLVTMRNDRDLSLPFLLKLPFVSGSVDHRFYMDGDSTIKENDKALLVQ